MEIHLDLDEVECYKLIRQLSRFDDGPNGTVDKPDSAGQWMSTLGENVLYKVRKALVA